MTQAEWLDACQQMEGPLRDLMSLAWSKNTDEPITIAINRGGLSWAEYREGGHKYEFDIRLNGKTNVMCDGECYFSKS